MYDCSFCGKTQDEVKQLIVGPQVTICNECISLCNEIILEKDHESKLDEVRRASFLEFWSTD